MKDLDIKAAGSKSQEKALKLFRTGAEQTIFVSAVAEPEAYHTGTDPIDPDIGIFGVGLSLKVRSDVAGTDAQKMHEVFLTSTLPNTTFALVKVVDYGPGGQITLIPVRATALNPNRPNGKLGNLYQWFIDREKALIDPEPRGYDGEFWKAAADAGAPGEVTEIEASQTSAFDLQRAAMNWLAPVPQAHGLVSLVETRMVIPAVKDPTISTDRYFLVPIQGNRADVYTYEGTELKENEIIVKYRHTGTGEDFTCVTPTLAPYAPPDGKVSDSIFRPDGFIREDKEAAAFYRLRTQVTSESAGQLWVLPTLLEMDPAKVRGWQGIEKLSFYDLCLCSALDPLLMTLGWDPEPGTNPNRRKRVSVLRGQLVAWIMAGLALTDETLSEKTEATLLGLLKAEIDKLSARRMTYGKPHPTWQFLRETVRNLADTDTYDLASRMPLSHKFFSTCNPEEDPKEADTAQVMRELADLMVLMEEENVTEAMVIQLLRQACGDDGGKLASAVGVEEKLSASMVYSSLQSVQRLLENDVNYSQSIRQTSGRIYSRLLTDAAFALDPKNPFLDFPAKYREVLTHTGNDSKNWFQRRIMPDLKKNDHAFAPLLSHLQGGNSEFSGDHHTELMKHLEERFGIVARSLLEDRMSGATFRPDTSPQPLPLRIGAGLDPELVDKISENITGYGVIIDTLDSNNKDNQTTSIVSLASIMERTGGVLSDAGVYPALPALQGGEAEMFINYEGEPLNDVQPAGTTLGGAVETAEQKKQRKAVSPPYVTNHVKKWRDTDPKLTASPALVYGINYFVRGFWQTNSGMLPHKLRNEDAHSPSDVAYSPKDAALVSQDVDWIRYHRRTAISQMEFTDAGGTAKLGQVPANVFPLARDYPRISISQWNGISTSADLFRNADGAGPIWKVGDTVTLVDVVASDDTTELMFEFIPSIHADKSHWVTGSVAIRDGRAVIPGPVTRPDHEVFNYWLRLRVSSGAVSFADPSGDAQGAGRADQEPIALVADNEGWTSAVLTEMHSRVSMPGVGFADFECWMSNSRLATEAGADGKGQMLLAALRRAKGVLELRNERLATLFRKMPDPAVSKLLVALEQSDSLRGEPFFLRHEVRAKKPYLYNSEMEAKVDAFNATTKLEDAEKAASDLILLIHERAELLIKHVPGSAASLTFSGGDKDGTITVPEGKVARLRVMPVIDKSLVEGESASLNIIKTEITSGRIALKGNDIVMPGTSLLVESLMHTDQDAKNKLAVDPVINVVPEGQSRSYALVLNGRGHAFSRIFGELDVSTQRWRFCGRPQYYAVRPRNFQTNRNSPIVNMTGKDSVNVLRFEANAYLGRSNQDAEHKRYRLNPLSAATVLGRYPWQSSSATWFRHRFRAHNRYRGAVLGHRSSIATWNGDSKDLWHTRVAVLADLSGAKKTRPQSRAMVPSTKTVATPTGTDAAANGQVPPVVCVLSERPFDQMGLADRIVASFETVHKYGFRPVPDSAPLVKSDKKEKDNDGAAAVAVQSPVLGLRDLRREVGPDPRLSYHGISAEASRHCRLRVEGPMGLHFERATTSVPAFSNAQYLLHYDLPTNRPDLEESFAGIVLQRYVDPDWAWWPTTSDVAGAALPATWWLDLANLPSGTTKLIPLVHGVSTGTPVLVITRRPLSLTIKVSGEAAYDSNGVDYVVLADIDLEVESPSILHQRLGDGRHAVSVMARRMNPDIDGRGDLDTPQMVARTVYRANGTLTLTAPDDEKVEVIPAQASQSTFVEWVRTNRNLSEFMAAKPKVDETTRIAVSDLIARISSDSVMSFETDKGRYLLRSPVSTRPYPLNVRRLQAAILRLSSKSIGRPFDLFQSAHLLDPDGTVRLPEDVELADASVSLTEIEARAEILVAGGSSLNQNFTKFLSAQFDVFNSRSPNSNNRLKTLRFDLRAANRAFADGERVSLSISDNVRPKISRNFEFVCVGPTRHLTLIVSTDTSAPGYTDGALRLDRFDELADVGSLNITMTTSGQVNDPLWADLSMLHSTRETKMTESQSIDFDWMFGQHEGELDLTEATSPTRLLELPETQARMIGLSDAIQVIK